jgi:hypothetical protein
MRVLLLSLCFLLCFVGCRSERPLMREERNQASSEIRNQQAAIIAHFQRKSPPVENGASTIPLSANTSDSAPPLPSWAERVRQAIACLGKNKEAIVTTFGDPRIANEQVYGYWVEENEGNRNNTNLDFHLSENGRCETVMRSFSNETYYPTADAAWLGVGAVGTRPLCALSDAQSIQKFWSENSVMPTVPSFGLTLKGKLPGGTLVLLRCVALQPSMKCSTRWNTTTNRREAGKPEPNPDFDWKQCSVTRIDVTRRHHLASDEYERHPYMGMTFFSAPETETAYPLPSR